MEGLIENFVSALGQMLAKNRFVAHQNELAFELGIGTHRESPVAHGHLPLHLG